MRKKERERERYKRGKGSKRKRKLILTNDSPELITIIVSTLMY